VSKANQIQLLLTEVHVLIGVILVDQNNDAAGRWQNGASKLIFAGALEVSRPAPTRELILNKTSGSNVESLAWRTPEGGKTTRVSGRAEGSSANTTALVIPGDDSDWIEFTMQCAHSACQDMSAGWRRCAPGKGRAAS